MKCVPSVAVVILMLCFSKVGPVTVREGDDVTLNCTYTRSSPALPPEPTVIWKSPSGKTLPPPPDPLRLALRRVSVNQSGRYECHIRDVRYQQNIYLNVTQTAVKTEVAEPTGGAAVSRPSVVSVATLLFLLPLHLI